MAFQKQINGGMNMAKKRYVSPLFVSSNGDETVIYKPSEDTEGSDPLYGDDLEPEMIANLRSLDSSVLASYDDDHDGFITKDEYLNHWGY